MSERDSFLQEVTEEVQRDRMVQTLRKFAPWIAAVLLALIAALSISEYLDWSARRAAEARGDAMQAALTAESAEESLAALETLAADAGPADVLVRLQIAGLQAQSGDREAAVRTLEAIASDPDVRPIYVDVARLKLAMAGAGGILPAEERRSILDRLAQEGHPLRGLAEEQIAMIALERGERSAALEALRRSLESPELGRASRQRVAALITALGGEPPAPAAPDLDG